VRIGVRVNMPWFVGEIRNYLPPGWHFQKSPKVDRLYSFVLSDRKPRPGIKTFHLLYADIQNLARTPHQEELLEAFESDLNNYIGQSARISFFVHAGVVGWKGQAIVIPGRSHSGKTMLVKEFLQHGASYYSDDFAVFDERGYVSPFAKPLGIRELTSQKQTRILPTELDSKVGAATLPVGLLLFTHYRKSACWNPGAMTIGGGMLGLLANALAARQQPERALALLERVARGARILTGDRGEAKDVVRTVLDWPGELNPKV
jgi:hypothetical protein